MKVLSFAMFTALAAIALVASPPNSVMAGAQAQSDQKAALSVTSIADALLGQAAPNPTFDTNLDEKLDAADVTAAYVGGAPARRLSLQLPGAVTLDMLHIPAGTFLMGSPEEELGRMSNEGPQTQVTLTRDFYMARTHITQSQWEAVMGIGVWPGIGPPSATNGLGPDFPIYNVTWNDATSFTLALASHLAAMGQPGVEVRLPTEAEWEYACRAGTTTRFYFGDSLCNPITDPLFNCEAGDMPGTRSDYLWWYANASGRCQPVATKLPNRWGLHDMGGNLWHLCLDFYQGSLPGGSVTDPSGPGTGSHRAVRGGAWANPLTHVRSASREMQLPTMGSRSVGFRIVMFNLP
jgi:formylglycine-generating enzyme required for sulfatase activity